MRVFVTGVGGQLGFDVVNELKKRDYEAIGSDILDEVAADCAYVKLDITVPHGPQWTLPRTRRISLRCVPSMWTELRILQMSAKS